MVAAAVANKPAGAAQAGQAAPVRLPLFPVGVLRSENPDYDVTKLQSAANQVQFDNHSFEPTGWLRGLWFQFDMVTAANAAAVAYKEDGPFSVVQKITLKDKGNREVFGPLGGYDWMTINKYGAYHMVGDPRADLSFSIVATAVATGGSFSFVLYLPMELCNRDALGAVENKSSSSAWKSELFMDTTANVYTVAPTTPGNLRCRITEDSYTEPAETDEHGRPLSQTPPAPGTLQYWVNESLALGAGTQPYNVDNGIGYSIRNLIFKFIDTAAGTRAAGDADWPDPATLTYGKVQLFQRFKNLWISKIGRYYGDNTPAVTTAAGVTTFNRDTAGGRENAVFPVWFTDDFQLQPGAELRNGYLNTKVGTVLKLKGAYGLAGVLNVAVNYVIPPGNDPGRLRSG